MHDRPRHPLPRRRTGMAAGPLVVLVSSSLLSGCASPPPEPVPSPVPSLTQEQQDDAAFRDVMTRYNELDGATATDDDLVPLLTGSVLESEKQSIESARETGESVEGLATLSGFRVTDRGVDGDQAPYMTAQVCLDVSGTRIRDTQGTDVTPARDSRLSLQVKSVKGSDEAWRISDIVRNEDVHACA
ncbi:hypothetical protein C5B94_15715 [Clavibacter michiganensis]|nr:hypothetical protein C5B94_15715 [Clavibacter michiganensis]